MAFCEDVNAQVSIQGAELANRASAYTLPEYYHSMCQYLRSRILSIPFLFVLSQLK